jgi:hypothetical protein
MSSQQQEHFVAPPKAPDLSRKIRLYNFQYVGMAIMLLIPILALAGAFGESFTTVEAVSRDLRLTVDYATRYRYKMLNSLVAEIDNLTDTDIPKLTITFSRDYIDWFSTVVFSPAATLITDTVYEVELQDVRAGETQVVAVELQGERYGIHTGLITAVAEGLEPVSVEVSTIIFP